MNVSRREYKGRLIPAGGQQDISHCQEHMRKEATKWAAVFDFEWWQTTYKDKDSIKRVSLNISLKQSIKKLIKEHSNDLSVRILPKIARLMVEGGVWWQIRKPGMYWGAIWGQKKAFWGQPPLSWGNQITNNEPQSPQMTLLIRCPILEKIRFIPTFNVFFQVEIWLFLPEGECSWVNNHPDVWSESEWSFSGDICPKFLPHEYNWWSDNCLKSLVKNTRTLATKLSTPAPLQALLRSCSPASFHIFSWRWCRPSTLMMVMEVMVMMTMKARLPLLFSWPTHPFVSLVDYKGRLPRDKGPDLLNLLK